MWLIGDTHGCYKSYLYVLNKMQLKGGKKGMDCSLQVGDMGIGFPSLEEYSKDGKTWPPEISQQHKWIKGNHDNPDLCKQHPNYLGDFGYCEFPQLFYIGGGLSIDKQWRIEGSTWWRNEELNFDETNKVIELYEKYKPPIMISHECPTEIKSEVVTNTDKIEITSYTEKLLQNLLDIHRPDIWIFGHHHKKLEKKNKNTLFVGLHELMFGKTSDCIYEIPDLKWE